LIKTDLFRQALGHRQSTFFNAKGRLCARIRHSRQHSAAHFLVLEAM